MTEEHDYEVGYKKPPKDTQWKKGQSGNPNGRPRKEKDFEKLLDIELSQTLHITEGGRQISLAKREVILKTLINDALKGNLRATKMILPYIVKQQAVVGFEPDAADREAFERLMSEFKQVDESKEAKETGDG